MVGDGQIFSGQVKETSENDSVWNKISREVNLVGDGIGGGFKKGLDESLHDPMGTGLRLATSVGAGVALAYFTKGGGAMGLLARGVGIGMGVSFVADVASPTRWSAVGSAVSDTWNSSANFEHNKGVIENQLGRFAFDTALMTVGGVAGGKFGESLALKGGMTSGLMSTFDAKLPMPLERTSGGVLRAAGFTDGHLINDSLPRLEVLPPEPLVANKGGHILTATTLPLSDMVASAKARDGIKFEWKEGKTVEWAPNEQGIRARVEAQAFVDAFMKKDYEEALRIAIETPAIRGVPLGVGERQGKMISVEAMKDEFSMRSLMDRMAAVGVFKWDQFTSNVDPIGQIKFKAAVPRPAIRLSNDGPIVNLIDYASKGEYDTYKLEFPKTAVNGVPLTEAQLSEIAAVRKSPEGQRLIAESALIAFEENLVHANQVQGSGDIIAPTFAEYMRDRYQDTGFRPFLLKFLGALDRKATQTPFFHEQEVPMMLYDAGMPLPLIERHYFFGGRHVQERTPIIEFLRKKEGS